VATTGADPVVGDGGRLFGATTPSGTMAGSDNLRIRGPVDLIVTGNVSFGGNSHLSVDTSFRISAWSELTGAAGSGVAFARDNRAPFNTLF